MKLKLIAVALSLTSSLALADYTFNSHNQFYVGVGGGYGGMITKQASLPLSLSDNNTVTEQQLRNGIAYRSELGYLWAVDHDSYGFEVGYMGYPKNTYDINNTHPSLIYRGYAADLLAVFQHNYNDGWDVNAKLGGAYVRQKLENPQGNASIYTNKAIFSSQSKILPEAALGLGYNLTQHFGFDFSAHYIFGGSATQNFATTSSANAINKVASVAAAFIGVHLEF